LTPTNKRIRPSTPFQQPIAIRKAGLRTQFDSVRQKQGALSYQERGMRRYLMGQGKKEKVRKRNLHSKRKTGGKINQRLNLLGEGEDTVAKIGKMISGG